MNIETDTELHKAKLILKIFMQDIEYFLNEHASEKTCSGNLSPGLQERVNSSMNTMIEELKSL